MITTATPARYTVIYRTGGPERFEWRRTLCSGTREQMVHEAAKCQNAGYRALVHNAAQLDAIGLPDTWD